MKKVEPILTIQPVRFMKNTYELIWSDEALNNLKGIIVYCMRSSEAFEGLWLETKVGVAG